MNPGILPFGTSEMNLNVPESLLPNGAASFTARESESFKLGAINPRFRYTESADGHDMEGAREVRATA